MRTNWFIVIQARGAWWIDNEGMEFGPFPTKEMAAAEALTIARKFGDARRRSRLYWPAENGEHTLIWEGTEVEPGM